MGRGGQEYPEKVRSIVSLNEVAGMRCYIGIDIGTKAALFDEGGQPSLPHSGIASVSAP
jgi:hypothetical protein